MKKIFYLITIIISMLTVNVYASNTADYTLTITDNFKFKESIKYSITDYKKIPNGGIRFNDVNQLVEQYRKILKKLDE